MVPLPLPGVGQSVVAAEAPAPGPGNWSGAPSAALDRDGGFVIAYRVRLAGERGSTLLLARSDDGERLNVVATLSKARFGAESLAPCAGPAHGRRTRPRVTSALPRRRCARRRWVPPVLRVASGRREP